MSRTSFGVAVLLVRAVVTLSVVHKPRCDAVITEFCQLSVRVQLLQLHHCLLLFLLLLKIPQQLYVHLV